MKKTKLGKIIKKVYDKINSKEFLEVSKMKEKDFTRNRKMDFPKLMIFILSGTKKSLQSALFAFNSRFKFENGTYSKGKSSCGCGCSNCPMSGSCHSQK